MNKNKHILIIEDDIFIAEAVTLCLALEGYTDVECQLTAEDGLEAVDERTPDLIVLDFMLPDHDGGWFLAQLAHKGVREQIPVFLLTADNSALAAYGDMAEFALSKPFDINVLLDAVEKLLAGELTVVPQATALR